MKRLNVEGLIKFRQKHNVEMKIECVMQNEQIYDLAINHSLAPLFKQKRMKILNVKKMESSSKINLKDVS
jgi:hypothetical protein